jgi:hypothetical protein
MHHPAASATAMDHLPLTSPAASPSSLQGGGKMVDAYKRALTTAAAYAVLARDLLPDELRSAARWAAAFVRARRAGAAHAGDPAPVRHGVQREPPLRRGARVPGHPDRPKRHAPARPRAVPLQGPRRWRRVEHAAAHGARGHHRRRLRRRRVQVDGSRVSDPVLSKARSLEGKRQKELALAQWAVAWTSRPVVAAKWSSY